MTPRETGAAAIWASYNDMPCEWNALKPAHQEPWLCAFDAAVAAYTLLAAERGWTMRPDEATEEMILAGMYDNTVSRGITIARPEVIEVHRVMCAVAPKFALDKRPRHNQANG